MITSFLGFGQFFYHSDINAAKSNWFKPNIKKCTVGKDDGHKTKQPVGFISVPKN